jgi:hypothetical protein
MRVRRSRFRTSGEAWLASVQQCDSPSQADTIPEMRQEQNRTSAWRTRLSQNLFAGEAPVASADAIDQEERNTKVRRAILLMLCAGLMILAVAVGVALGVSKGGESVILVASNDESEDEIEVVSTRREATIRSNLEALFLIDSSVFYSKSSPQTKALKWLANRDEAQIDEDDVTRLATRFALSTLYFSTKGEFWHDGLQFLSSDHECNWKSESTTQGVSCNEQETVVGITIGKYSNNFTLSFIDCIFVYAD